MLLLRSMLTSVLLLVVALPSTADESLPELLKQVDPAVAAKLMGKTNFDFREQRYLAKKFRIVDINWELLDKDDARFTITPFEEPKFKTLAITARTKTIDQDTNNYDWVQRWTGEIEESTWLEQGGPRGELLWLWIKGPKEVPSEGAQEIEAETGAAASNAFGTARTPPKAPDTRRATISADVRTVSGEWVALPGYKFRLEPISSDPRYHMVMWVDRDKVRSGVHGGPDSQRKLKEYMEFRDQLEKERAEAASATPE